AERCTGVRQKVRAAKTHGVGVPENVSKGDATGPALRGIHEIARPRIIAYIRLAAKPDVKPVESVVQNRNIYAGDLQDRHKRQAGEKLHLVGVGVRPVGGEGVGDEVFDQEGAHGHDPAQRMQSTPQKRVALTGTNWRYATSNWRGNTCHELL